MMRDRGFVLYGREFRRRLDNHLSALRERYPGREFTRTEKARELVLDGIEREQRRLRLTKE